MDGLLYYLISGATFGLAAGFAPGPLLTLVISETIKYNSREGIKIAFAPLLSDLPIILVSVSILSYFQHQAMVLTLVSLAGAVYLCLLALDNFFPIRQQFNQVFAKPQSLRKGVITNFLNPHPYIFWLTIGSPFLINSTPARATIFLLALYILLVGTKILIAVLIGQGKRFLQSNAYYLANKLLGLALIGFAIHLFYLGLTTLIPNN